MASPENPVEFRFEAAKQRDYFTLHEAVLWAGCGGSTQRQIEMSYEDLISNGEKEIFKLLEQGELTSTGVRISTMLREDIPGNVWERASWYGGEAYSGHRVGYIDFIRREENGGELTLFKESEPRWADIRISKSDVLNYFPFPSNGGTAVPRIIQDASPVKRRKSKQQIVMTFIEKAFPNGLPPPTEMDNKTFLKTLSLPKGMMIHDRTILRAAGRAK